MTAHCRPLLLATAAIALTLPACLSFQLQPAEAATEARDKPAAEARAKDQPRKDRFAELPSRPGEVVALKGAGKDAKAAKDAKDAKDSGEPRPPVVPDSNVTVAGDATPPLPLPTLKPPEPPLLAILRAHLENHPDRAMEILHKALEPANQEIVLAVMPALVRGATADLASDPTAAALLADQLRSAAARLASRAALVVENVTLCEMVEGFGRYHPRREGDRYRTNQQGQLYLEVRNLVSQPASGPRGETHLTYVRAAVEIRDAHGRLVDQPDPDDRRRRVPVVRFEEKRYSHGPLDDFHLLYTFQVPPAPGVYTITVELRDPAGRRAVKTPPVRFDVAGP